VTSLAETQPDLFGAEGMKPSSAAAPPGFVYRPDVLTAAAEADLVRHLETLPFKPFDFHGYLGNRLTVALGFSYDYSRGSVGPAAPIPDFLLGLREAVASIAGVRPEAFVQALAIRYPPGAGIGWHRDKPQFGLVIGVSLLAPCVLRFRRRTGAKWARATTPLKPRSAYLLSGEARSEWQHSIVPMDRLRYAITFRTLAQPETQPSGPSPPAGEGGREAAG
jgi:alkylated DNA repair dioxygenase AlkB